MRTRMVLVGTMAGLALVVSACSSPTSDDSSQSAAVVSSTVSGSSGAAPGSEAASASGTARGSSVLSDEDAVNTVVDFMSAGLPDLGGKKIAYLSECVTENNFCQTRLHSVEQAAKDMNFELTTFNGAFSTDTQLKQVQDAIQQGFDAYIYAPVADAAGCANWKLLEKTGKPVVTIDSPMCGDVNFTSGTAGYVSMTSPDFYINGAKNVFDSCEGKPCKAVVLGGYVGTDLYERWQRSIATAAADYPNVEIVANQPADFGAAKGLSIMQDALSANPDIQVVYSQSDDISRGVVEAVKAAGKVPGTDVRIYGTGGTVDASKGLADGTINATNALLPKQEGYYPAVILARALTTGEFTPGFTNLAYSPVITDGPGTPWITKDNMDKFQPQW